MIYNKNFIWNIKYTYIYWNKTKNIINKASTNIIYINIRIIINKVFHKQYYNGRNIRKIKYIYIYTCNLTLK